MLRLALSIIFTFFTLLIFGQGVIDLWSTPIPYAIPQSDYLEMIELDDSGNTQRISQVINPSLTFFDEVENENAPCVIICPGGGYKHLSINKEGYKVAQWLNSIGIKAFVLKYRLPTREISECPSQVPLQDLQQAVTLIKNNAKRWKVNQDKIGIMGFSAGGHLAAMGAYLADFSILIYPVISMDSTITHMGSRTRLIGAQPADSLIQYYSADMKVSPNTPPSFIVHAQDDNAVSVVNTLRYYDALCQHDISATMHIYDIGGHGFGMVRDDRIHPWVYALQDWLSRNILLR